MICMHILLIDTKLYDKRQNLIGHDIYVDARIRIVWLHPFQAATRQTSSSDSNPSHGAGRDGSVGM